MSRQCWMRVWLAFLHVSVASMSAQAEMYFPAWKSVVERSGLVSPTLSAHVPSRLFQHFDSDKDGKLSEAEVAVLLKQLTRKRKEQSPKTQSGRGTMKNSEGHHDISIDGETLSVRDGEFDLLFKQLSNLKHTKDPSKDPRMTLQEDIVFIKDLVLVFSAATIGGVLGTHFRQPPLIGFLLGGMVIGPGGLGIVTELVEIETLASLGISFLLFALGIEFSISDLQGVRRLVLVGGFSSMLGIILACGVLSQLLGLVKSPPEAIALGLAVSLSSTAVVLQCLPSCGPSDVRESQSSSSFDRTRSKDPATEDFSISCTHSFDSARSRKVMLGLLVFQDVTIGLILALLPTLRGSMNEFFEECFRAVLRLGCFVTFSLILGEFLLPVVVERLVMAKSQEVFTIGCVVVCLALSYVSERMGLAIELGAFSAGLLLSESRHKSRIEECISSVRSVFSSVFFVSVGMMIHWRYFYQNFTKMAILLVVIMSVKSTVMGGVLCVLSGLPFRIALACGASIAQAGEFTFVVTSKGQALQLFSAAEARMLNGATALSMLLTPYVIRLVRRWSTAKS